jgi:phage shock protein E
MSFENINPADAKARIEGDSGVIVIDVRTVEEFDEGHVPGAYNVPFAFKGPFGMAPNPDFATAMQKLFPSDAALVLV